MIAKKSGASLAFYALLGTVGAGSAAPARTSRTAGLSFPKASGHAETMADR